MVSGELPDEVVEGRVSLRSSILQGGGKIDLLDWIGLAEGVRNYKRVLGLAEWAAVSFDFLLLVRIAPSQRESS